jgi:hypothetical protein
MNVIGPQFLWFVVLSCLKLKLTGSQLRDKYIQLNPPSKIPMGIPQKNVSGIASSANNITIGVAIIKQAKEKKTVLATSRFFTIPFLIDQINQDVV